MEEQAGRNRESELTSEAECTGSEEASTASGPFRFIAFPFLAGLGILFAVAFLDWLISSEMSFSVLYLLPVAMVTWYSGRRAGVAMSILTGVGWYLAEAERIGAEESLGPGAAVWGAVSRLCFFVVVALLVDRIRLLTHNLETLVRTRTAALKREILRREQLEKESVVIAEQEQERVANELHDDLAAYLAGIAFRAKFLAENLETRGVPEAADAENIVLLVERATDQVRSLARLLAPVEDASIDLRVALSRLGREVETVFRITCTVEVPHQLPTLTQEQCAQLYRIAQEAVRNAVQHSHAELVQISVSQREDHMRMSVRCDGRPWHPTPEPSSGLGLQIMRRRTEKIRGTLRIEPIATGGALVSCDLPMVASIEASFPPPSGPQQERPHVQADSGVGRR